jgi:hypothetical protein
MKIFNLKKKKTKTKTELHKEKKKINFFFTVMYKNFLYF